MDEKFKKFILSYDSTKVGYLPKIMKRRLDALKKLQLEQIKILHEYHKEVQELEHKYDNLYKPLYEKRYKIINGDYEPNDDECKLPEKLVESESENQENIIAEIAPEAAVQFTPEEESQLEKDVKGLPGFWLGCLASSYNFGDSIEDHDRDVLRYLKDIRLSYNKGDDLLKYTLEFVFDDNPYFKNKCLTKTYHLKLSPDENDPFSYEGFEITKSEGCDIEWFPGKDVTKKQVTVKQTNKRDGRTRQKQKEVENDSFFFFFKPATDPDQQDIEAVNALMAVDFELGENIRQTFIPRATLIYAGYMQDDDDDDDEDDDLDDEDDETDSDDCDDVSSDDDDESDDSHDSLEKKVGKEK